MPLANQYETEHGSIACDNGGGARDFASGSAAATTNDEDDDDEDSTDGLVPPLFRSVAVQPHFDSAFASRGGATDLGRKTSNSIFQAKGPGKKESRGGASLVRPAAVAAASDATLREWKAHALEHTYVIPCYYPRACEKRSITCSKSIDSLLERLFCCFKKLNIHARYENSFATFGLVLRTAEHLELSLLIWYTDKARSMLYIEVDKRQVGCGCGGAFPLQYICRILKAVKCGQETLESDSLCLPKHQEIQSGNVTMSEQCRKMDLLVCPCAPKPKEESKAPCAQSGNKNMSFSCVGEQSLSSLQTINGLLQVPVTWGQGLELLSTVSDPTKSGVQSSEIFAKVILLGVSPMAHGASCCRSIHEKLVSLMQSLVGESKDSMTGQFSAYQKDCLLQLVLSCLVNAMEVHAKFAVEGGSSSMNVVVEAPGTGDPVMNQFLESTKGVVACDILETLLAIVRRANTKPHHAYLSVKALFLLSSENPSIRQHVSRAMSSGDVDGARRCALLQQAQEVGTRSHGLLEAECERLSSVLESRH